MIQADYSMSEIENMIHARVVHPRARIAAIAAFNRPGRRNRLQTGSGHSLFQRQSHLGGKDAVFRLSVQKTMIFCYDVVNSYQTETMAAFFTGMEEISGPSGTALHGIGDGNIELFFQNVNIDTDKALFLRKLQTGFHGIVQQIADQYR